MFYYFVSVYNLVTISQVPRFFKIQHIIFYFNLTQFAEKYFS